MEFETTRSVLGQLDDWLTCLALPHLPPQEVAEPAGEFHWEFAEQTPVNLQVGKAVRMVSAIHAAMLLAEQGYSTECASLLRMVSDFSQEIIAIGEGILEGRLTTDQKDFVDQYFASPARTPEELEQRGRQYYVSREKLLAAHQRLSDRTTRKGEPLLRATRFLNYGYDKYVHGGYLTAMELYRGDRREFMTSGSPFGYHRCVGRRSVAGKLHEVLHALMIMALGTRDQQLWEELSAADDRLAAAHDQAVPCK
jgi:hypothetical protein